MASGVDPSVKKAVSGGAKLRLQGWVKADVTHRAELRPGGQIDRVEISR